MDKVILLVEDSADDEALMMRALARAGLTPHAVVIRDGAEALDYIFARGRHAGRSQHQWIMAAVIDLKMSRVQGLDILRQIRASELLKSLPVVILTSSDEERDLVETYHLGASSYVRKTIDFTQFANDIQRIFDYWLNINQVPLLPFKARLTH